MKLYRLSLPVLAALTVCSCDEIENQFPQGSGLTTKQDQTAVEAAPELAEASFEGLFSMMGYPNYALGGSRPDDYGYVMMAMCNDLEGADCIFPNSNYNWFSVCGELSSRTASYANPRIRYATPYNQIKLANDIILSLSGSENPENINKIAQCRAIRAFAYEQIAPSFQFLSELNAPCVPLVTEKTTDFTNNPRATVQEVYNLIFEDLNYAIDSLAGYKRDNKARIDQQVAYGLRARAYLALGKYAEAAADAEKAMQGYTPASIEEVSKPSFCDIEEHNWLWGYDMTTTIAALYPYASCSAWICSFSGEGYSTGTGCYAMINTLLYNKIPATDVRKGWWVDENLESPNLAGVDWAGTKGNAVAPLAIDDVKEPFEPYTNVKFGMAAGVGSTNNNSDWPFMRVEEMILIQAEGLAKSGNEAKAKEVLTNFVKTYRDPAYDLADVRNLNDEIWKQRRIELWGEGFFVSDANRLQKPIVRFHDSEPCNQPEDFAFNLKVDDGWRLLRFPQSEMNTNFGIEDNKDGSKPTVGQEGTLRDGVTD
ncbi:MAG: RagB/SusD family nutrient uptake outer membrane protein [Bacteroidaceae bacterium]|nr:RagB/SusD family nutrient uptake outer membrane protein [Bacteroidaceae bacterium]